MNTCFSQLNEAEQKSVLQMLKTFVDSKVPERNEPIDTEQYNKDIDESLIEIERGEFYTHEEVTKLMRNYGLQ